ncbi:hypothetical protein BGZ97_001086 [Linnemannia gamsii]|uniref:Uncharacterized protein n=1 Tax=Linnemannia gamsii TaxID=64522 RepID=A0A9P6R1V0_9FUNG|nr:hypothetical protein BGZ97_001086 [Linnemannia gamsii]
MDSAEETLRVKLLSEKQATTDEQRLKARRDALSDIERQILGHLCERIKPKEGGEDEDAGKTKRDSNSDLDEKDKENEEDTAKDKKKSSAGVVVNHLIAWLVAGHFYKPIRRRDEIEVKMPYTPTHLVRSVAGKLTVEFKNMYIQEEISAAESFLSLNKHTKNSRRIVSFTTSQQPFVSFSEQELGHVHEFRKGRSGEKWYKIKDCETKVKRAQFDQAIAAITLEPQGSSHIFIYFQSS